MKSRFAIIIFSLGYVAAHTLCQGQSNVYSLNIPSFAERNGLAHPLLVALPPVPPGHADTNAVERAVLAFPGVSAWEFRPDEAVRSANVLIAVGREPACAGLRKVASMKWGFPKGYEVNQKVCYLCRLLFVPRTEGEVLRAPGLGAPELLPLNSMREADWPFMPFAIVQNVPLSMTIGYSLEGGLPEKSDSYLAYCMTNGTFRTQPFPIPTPTTSSNALQQVLGSPAWKSLKWQDSGLGWSYALDQGYAREALWKQVENMENKTARPAAAR